MVSKKSTTIKATLSSAVLTSLFFAVPLSFTASAIPKPRGVNMPFEINLRIGKYVSDFSNNRYFVDSSNYFQTLRGRCTSAYIKELRKALLAEIGEHYTDRLITADLRQLTLSQKKGLARKVIDYCKTIGNNNGVITGEILIDTITGNIE